MVTALTTGKPKGKPRGKPFPKGASGNPEGKAIGPHVRRETIMDVRLLARDHGPGAIEKLAAIMNSKTATDMAVIAASNSLLDRGWGRPPQAVELFQADAAYELKESEERAREQLYGRLVQLGVRLSITTGNQRPDAGSGQSVGVGLDVLGQTGAATPER